MGLWKRLKRWYAGKSDQASPESEPAENINFSLLMPRGVLPGWTEPGERHTNPRPVEMIADYSPLQLGGIEDLGAGVDTGPVTGDCTAVDLQTGTIEPCPVPDTNTTVDVPAASFDSPAPADVPQV